MRLLFRPEQAVDCVLNNPGIDEVCLAWMLWSRECILRNYMQKYTRLVCIKSGLDRGSDFLRKKSLT